MMHAVSICALELHAYLANMTMSYMYTILLFILRELRKCITSVNFGNDNTKSVFHSSESPYKIVHGHTDLADTGMQIH
jgi:hypothetical protein